MAKIDVDCPKFEFEMQQALLVRLEVKGKGERDAALN
jgi:hypothetical protein